MREARGGAVVAMRFDCNEIGDIISEVAAYGTVVEPITASAAPGPAATGPEPIAH
jgi:hypothetical protein